MKKAIVKCRLTGRVLNVSIKETYPVSSVYGGEILLSTGFVAYYFSKSGVNYILDKNFPKVIS